MFLYPRLKLFVFLSFLLSVCAAADPKNHQEEFRKFQNCQDVLSIKYFEDEQLMLIRVKAFCEGITRDLGNRLRNFVKNDSQIKGLILDLRNNPGGVLYESAGVASIFLPPDTVVTHVTGRTKEKNFTVLTGRKFYQRNQNEPDFLINLPESLKKLPLAVIVDHGSINAAEIVAVALKEHKRATLIGKRTAGYTSISSEPSDTWQWLSPFGHLISNGVIPDIDIKTNDLLDTEEDYFLATARKLLKEGLSDQSNNAPNNP